MRDTNHYFLKISSGFIFKLKQNSSYVQDIHNHIDHSKTCHINSHRFRLDPGDVISPERFAFGVTNDDDVTCVDKYGWVRIE